MSKRKTPTKAEAKRRKAKFDQYRSHQKNLHKKHNLQVQEQQNMIRRAMIVEGIYNSRPDMAIEQNNTLSLNNDVVYLNENDNILYWKSDNNPIVSGLDEFDKYPLYSTEFVNNVLAFIYQHKQKQTSETESNIDLSDFDLIEENVEEVEHKEKN